MVNRTPKKISSTQNPLIKYFVKLREDKKFREQEKKALVAGNILIEELSCHQNPTTLFLLEGTKSRVSIPNTFLVTPEILKKITGLPSPPDAAAEFAIPSPSEMGGKKFLLACDKITDPGNLGTIIRSALSFGWEGIFFLNDSVDLFNDKVIRASRGGSFLLPYKVLQLEELKKFAKEHQLPIWIADLQGENLKSVRGQRSALLVLGTEGAGQSEEVRKMGKQVTIPIKSNMESLNVAVAASILMYEMIE